MRKLIAALVCVVALGSAITVRAEEVKKGDFDRLLRKVEAQEREIANLKAQQDESSQAKLQQRMLDFEREMLDLRNDLRQAGGSDMIPGWLSKDLKMYADIRLRYEFEAHDDRAYTGVIDPGPGATGGIIRTRYISNPAAGVNWNPEEEVSSKDRHRMRYRFRFGFSKSWGKEWSAGFRFASTVGGANSKNETLDGFFAEDAFGIDLVWITYKPECIPGLEITGGKFKNPFVSTSMVWDSDVNPEGLYEKYTAKVADNVEVFVTLAQMILDEEGQDDDTLGFAYQVGFDWNKIADVVDYTFAFTFYDWDRYESEAGAVAVGNYYPVGGMVFSGAGNNLITNKPWPNGNTVFSAGDFDIFNFTNLISFDVAVPGMEKKLPIGLKFDFAFNDDDAVTRYLGAPNNNNVIAYREVRSDDWNDAFSFEVKVGKAKKKGDWEVGYKWAHIEPNSVIGIFADSDFGGANQVGHCIKATYMVHDKVSLGMALFDTEPVYDPTHSISATPIFQFDVVFKY